MSLVLTRNSIAELLLLIHPFGLLDAELLGDVAQFLPSFISSLEEGKRLLVSVREIRFRRTRGAGGIRLGSSQLGHRHWGRRWPWLVVITLPLVIERKNKKLER